MKALVTGGAGFIGTNLIKRLLSGGHDVISMDNYSTGYASNHQEECRYLDFDCTDVESWKQVDEFWEGNVPDVIFHMAALARIQPSIKDPIPAIRNNFDSTLNVLEYARVNNIKVVFAGSSSYHHGLYESPYAWSKHSGEQLCKLYSNVYDVSTVICRFYNVYGNYQILTGEYATVIGIFCDQYFNEKPLTIVGDGEQRRDFTHVDDIVDGIVKASKGTWKAETFELGTGRNYSINEIAKYYGKDYPVKHISARAGEYDVTLCDYFKAHNELGYQPTGNIQLWIREFIGGDV
jgi:UDP-glucose 4-epimerase